MQHLKLWNADAKHGNRERQGFYRNACEEDTESYDLWKRPASQDLGITLRTRSSQNQDYLRQSLPVQQQLQLPNWTGERDMSSLRTR
ncbi:unnamed protein product [Brassica rapa subsp. narinosa]